ncbi:2-amino-4-hydroxy-6-hydroxymethyldihydropteridine diphosphokinase [Actinoplanes sp. TFC3]|uniref:2-amino-4-hydroxy-6- hydroxymethyldihydropteridine diphosphokinase n=1 Tax=Actinoplanes sp. TFC3 TaxID=1710355 RepID=UPI00082BFAC0|nr:2-amino-4-hydroxy-6-hydroxymethyldihydropteridine diphosphokinase [Actinoplanes sp. TFC3]
MTRALLSIGSNLGDRYAHLNAAVEALGGTVARVSPVYETPPWGDAEQPAYLNAAVLVIDAAADSRSWLTRARDLEQAAGRVRDPARRFGPRTLDVDVIAVWRDGEPVLSDDPELTLPHPRAHLRAFVLQPWLDLDSGAVLPGHGPVAELLVSPELATDAKALTPLRDLRLKSQE